MNRLILLYTSLLSLVALKVAAQEKLYNELIIKFESENPRLNLSLRNNTVLDKKLIFDDGNVYSVKFSNNITAEDLKEFKRDKNIVYAVYDAKTETRKLPNDRFVKEQWAIKAANIHKVWEFTTGGKTFDNKDIVIGIIDDGYAPRHKDLVNNIFINKAEVPNDRIDNDNNGYVDDYNGYSIGKGNNILDLESHGTGVAGILAAQGNNDIGVSGVNWNAKMLLISGITKTSDVIGAYNYMLKMRRLYRESNGSKGAYIVVTNYSGGVPGVYASDEPYATWCDLFNKLGEEGVLSVGSTLNNNVNIDDVGDMPSTCISPYFINVTNVGIDGKKVKRAAYSSTYVTMGAPGENIYTTDQGDSYNPGFNGTSAAAPMVAGTIALLHSLPCKAFSDRINSSPKNGALNIYNAIKTGINVEISLSQQTAWAGSLNSMEALRNLFRFCEPEELPKPSVIGKLNINSIANLATGIFGVYYTTPDNSTVYKIDVRDIYGRVWHTHQIDIPEFGPKLTIIDSNKIPYGIVLFTIYTEREIATRIAFNK